MCEMFNVLEDDCFMMLIEYDVSIFSVSLNYFGIVCSDDVVIIQIIVNNMCNLQQKQVFYCCIVELLGDKFGVWFEDVFINLVEVLFENWLFGNGFVQYVK